MSNFIQSCSLPSASSTRRSAGPVVHPIGFGVSRAVAFSRMVPSLSGDRSSACQFFTQCNLPSCSCCVNFRNRFLHPRPMALFFVAWPVRRCDAKHSVHCYFSSSRFAVDLVSWAYSTAGSTAVLEMLTLKAQLCNMSRTFLLFVCDLLRVSHGHLSEHQAVLFSVGVLFPSFFKLLRLSPASFSLTFLYSSHSASNFLRICLLNFLQSSLVALSPALIWAGRVIRCLVSFRTLLARTA